MAQRERLEAAAAQGAAPRRVLPFGVVMRDLEERAALTERDERHACQPGPDEALAAASLRLSPVERRNLEMINDPALAGYQAKGRQAAPEGSLRAGSSPQAGSDHGGAADDAEPTRLEGVVAEYLVIGADVLEVELGPSGPRALRSVEVDPANARFSTDGLALFSRDGAELVRLLVAVDEYRVPEGCTRIGPRAFDTVGELERISLPEGLQEIGRLAFAKTGLAFVDVPSSVRSIGEKAFFSCKGLRACLLAEGLQELGEEAFALSGLERVALPASLARLGAGAFDRTPAQRGMAQGTLTIDPGNPFLELDAQGGLYAGSELQGLLGCAAAYEVRPGTTSVADRACLRQGHLRALRLPEGIVSLGDEAFRGARLLEAVELPSTLERLGERAFADTRLSSLRLPAALQHVGEAALLVQGENPLRSARPLRRVEVADGNPVLYIESGLLCERGAGDAGGDKVLLYVGPDSCVRVPEAVNRIAPFALTGATEIDELHVHGHMHSICEGALSVARSIPRLVVDLPKPVEGCSRVDVRVPSLSPRYRTYTYLLTTDEAGTVFEFGYYDSWVSHATALEELVPAALARLREPVRLSERMREVYLGILARKQEKACALFASRGDLAACEALVGLGVLEMPAVEAALAEAMDSGDAQATACLLELKRRQGGAGGLDLSL